MLLSGVSRNIPFLRKQSGLWMQELIFNRRHQSLFIVRFKQAGNTFKVCLASLLCLMMVTVGWAVDRDIAIVLKATGNVTLQQANVSVAQEVSRGLHLNSGDQIRTGDDGFAAIMFTDDKTLVKLRGNSVLKIRGSRQQSTIAKRLNMPVGEMWVKVKPQKVKLKIETPSGVAAVKGTAFYILVDGIGNTKLYGIEGVTELSNSIGAVDVKAGMTGLATKTRAPSVHETIFAEQPTWGTEDKTEYELEIELINPSGEKRKLKIQYDDRN